VLLRDRPGGVEVFLLRRVLAMAFAGGMTAFPGGSVDARDAEAALRWIGPDPATWAERFGASAAVARAIAAAAVRETFEEAGVLLAAGTVMDRDWTAERVALERRELSLADLLTRHRLSLRTELLAPWSHWITPEIEPRRYDTRFLVAAVPAGQRTVQTTGEADDVAWARPADALAELASGHRRMFAPTIVTLREIAGYDAVADVVAAAPDRPIGAVLPTVRGRQVLLPDGSAFPVPGAPR